MDLNGLIVQKNLEGGTLWGFSTIIVMQIIRKFKGGPFGDIEKFSKKKSQKAKKGEWRKKWKGERGFYFILDAFKMKF